VQRSIDRVLTTHVGSLIRPPALLEFLRAQQARQPYDEAAHAKCLTDSVADIVRQQAAAGVDVVSDGEFGKSISWSQYVLERLSGFERRPIAPGANPFARGADRTRFPDFYAELDQREAPAGVMVHLGIHRIDSFVQLFGRMERVYAVAPPNTLDVPFADSVAIMVRFCTGMTGYVGSSLATPLNSRFQVFGSDGWVEARGPHDMQEYLRSSLNCVSVRTNDGRFESRGFEAVDSVRLNFEAFADAIEGKSPGPVPVEEIIHVVAVAQAVAKSLQTGEPAQVS